MSCGLDICYCQSNSIIYNILYCFNTSHITLYRKQSKSVRRQVTCFNTSHVTLYLSMSIKFPHCKHCFNTSHVTLYHSPGSGSTMLLGFNTSHVTLYRQSISLLHLYLKFQYISCYSLSIIETLWNVKKFVSIHLMLLFIYCRTSLLGNIKSFQYISCYSLSEQGERTASVRCRFNTSHVTLYHNRES